jgi:hypothetical protein
VLVDTDANSYKKTRPGAIYIFGLNYDEEEPTSLIEGGGDNRGRYRYGGIRLTLHQ